MARRAGAMLGIVAVVALSLFLMWQVWLHHEGTRHAAEDERSLVQIDFRAA